MNINFKSRFIYILILTLLFNNLHSKSFLDTFLSTFDSAGERIEFGLDYLPHQSMKFQEEVIAETHKIDFQNSFSMIPSPYISFKSKGYSIAKYFGLYLNSTLRYSLFDKQRAVLTDGSVSNIEIDLGTSVHNISFDITPSLFYYFDFGERSGKNSLVLETFSGLGISLYFGGKKEFIYPTGDEFLQEQNRTGLDVPPNFYISPNGTIAYIGESEDIGFGFGVNIVYGIRFKYIYENYNIHLVYQSPFVVGIDNYLNIKQILIGVGYSF